MSLKWISSLFLLLFLIGCGDAPEKSKDPFEGMSVDERKAAMESAMKRAGQKEQEQIDGYFKRHKIPAIKTETGVHYFIYEKGDGGLPKTGNVVEISFVVTKISGDTLFTSETNEFFPLEMAEKESGLHEALKLIPEGSKAIVAIPSYRAHGLVGDSDKIPPLTTVIYNLKLHSVQW